MNESEYLNISSDQARDGPGGSSELGSDWDGLAVRGLGRAVCLKLVTSPVCLSTEELSSYLANSMSEMKQLMGPTDYDQDFY